MSILGLFDLEYSFNLPTKLSKSSCFFCLFSSDRFCSSGLYRYIELRQNIIENNSSTDLEQFFFGWCDIIDKGWAFSLQFIQ